MPPRGPWHNLSGPRLPTGARGDDEGCFRCADARRILRGYAVSRAGKVIGSMRLCDDCSAALTRLDPDPLDVTTPA